MGESGLCPRCSAPSTGIVCPFCGSQLHELTDPKMEMLALDEYHGALAAKDSAGQVGLLRSGFLPMSLPVLIESGLRCISLTGCNASDVADSATHRLEAIVTKLKVLPETPDSRRAVEQFESVIQDHKKRETTDARNGCLAIGGLSIFIILLVFILIRYFIN
jgi:hypothetical protein